MSDYDFQYDKNKQEVIGLNLDDIIPSAYGSLGTSMVDMIEGQNILPPTVLLPRFKNEPLRADFELPAHPRGIGCSWPEESQVKSNTCLRYPLPYAWSVLSSGGRGGSYLEKYNPSDIISAYAGQFCKRLKRSHAVLVIPNNLTSAQQEELITFGRRHRVEFQLLWRPVAAALVWCQKYSQDLKEKLPNKLPDRFVLGNLIHLHLGLDCFNITELEIVAEKDLSGNEWIIPARKRPKSKSLRAFGLEVIHRFATDMSNNQHRQDGDCPEWKWLWGGTDLAKAFKSSQNNDTHWFDSYSKIIGQPLEWFENTPFKELVSFQPNDINEWIQSSQSNLSHNNQLGVVVTGSLAGIPFKDTDFGGFWLNRLGIIAERCIVEGDNESIGLAARGASLYAQRIANNQPTYLDTLPRIKMIVTKFGEPTWIDLLKEDEGYVEGGKEFRRKGIGDDAMNVPSGRKSLITVLNHEEYQTVREVESPFDIKTTELVPVSLSASIMPAQGNARLEVVSKQEKVLGEKGIFARWKTMSDTGKNSEQYLNSLDRICPVVTMRECGPEHWWKIKSLFKQVLNNTEQWYFDELKEIRIILQRRQGRIHPVSSDGLAPLFYQEILDEFVEEIVGTLKHESSTGEFYQDGWRLVAHAFASHKDIEPMLGRQIKKHGTDLSAGPLLAAGRCVRSTKYTAMFSEVFLCRLKQSHSSANDWLRAFSEIAKYRPNAFEKVPNGICESLWQNLVLIFRRELIPGDASLKKILPYSFVSMAFLLRRRAFNSDFMQPDSPLAMTAKKAACYAQEMVRLGKLVFSKNAAIDMEMELQRFIDYIDKKGHGSIEMADFD